jgi:hypothetical protein
VIRVFENMYRDILWQREHSDEARAIQKFYGPKWQSENPVFINPDGSRWRPPGYKPERGRSPVHTRFKRTQETADRDRKALDLREMGLSYDEIAAHCGYGSRATAYKAVARAMKDVSRASQSRVSQRKDRAGSQSRGNKPPIADAGTPVPRLGNARGRRFPGGKPPVAAILSSLEKSRAPLDS